MDPVRFCSEWGCKMVREIPDAFQLHISEFNPEPGDTNPEPVVHILRMTAPQWAALNAAFPDYLLSIERMAQRDGYSYTKDEIKYLVARGTEIAGNHEPLAESQFRRQAMSPSKWFLKFVTPCNSTDSELSVKAGQFAAAWVASWKSVTVPEFLYGQDVQDAYRSMPYMYKAGSCMCGVEGGVEKWRFTEIWTSNPQRCAMAVIRDGNDEIIERCLMVLPDTMPVDTPMGPGWMHSRIYPGDTPVSRAIMGPWLVRNGITSIRNTCNHIVVSGFRFLKNRYLPYMDVGNFVWSGDGDEGDPVEFHVNDESIHRGNRNAYPYHYDNSTMGGPYARRVTRCNDCDCGIDLDEDDDYREHNGRIYCTSCFDDTYSYCEINDGYYPSDEFLDVHGCCLERVWQGTDSFHHRIRYGDPAREVYVRIELANGDNAFVPQSEVVNGRWVQDMEDNGWVRLPRIRYRSLSDGPSVWLCETDEDEYDWFDPSNLDEFNSVTVKTDDEDEPMTATFYSSVDTMIVRAIRRDGLSLRYDGRDQRLHIVDDHGNQYLIRPTAPVGYKMTQDTEYNPYDLNHNINLFGSSITGFFFTKIETADTAENASNL